MNEMIGPYQIEQEIASGGMGTVYRARHVELGQEVALKVLLPSLSDDERLIARFRREARSASALYHPNIIELRDLGVADGKHYMAMEYVPGGSLQDLLKRQGALDERSALGYCRQIANALQYAHGRGLVHRDVKPSNVLLRGDGTCVLADFGIVLATGGTKLTQTVSAIGTPDYMSPEQVLGRKLDGRSDVYSLGMMLYEMLAGHPPYYASGSESPVTIINKHLTTPIPPIDQRRKALSRATRLILDRACAKRPEDRFASASAMARAIDLALGEQNMSRLQRLGTQLGLLRPASDSPARKLAWTFGGFLARLLGFVATLFVVLLLVVGGLATFIASIGLERFIGNSTWNLRSTLSGTTYANLDDIRLQMSSAISTFSLGVAQYRNLSFEPPDTVRAAVFADPYDLGATLRLKIENGAPHLELVDVNGTKLPVIGPALMRGVNRGMLQAWRKEHMLLRDMSITDRQLMLSAEAVAGPMPDIVESQTDGNLFGGIDSALIATIALPAFGVGLLWLTRRLLLLWRIRAARRKRLAEAVEDLDAKEVLDEPGHTSGTLRFARQGASNMTQSYRPGVAILEVQDVDGIGRSIPIGQPGREVVGIGSDCSPGDPCVSLNLDGIARKHAMIEWSDGKLWLTDAGSQAGTYVNGMKVTSRSVLSPGDAVSFGPVKARIRGRDGPKSAEEQLQSPT